MLKLKLPNFLKKKELSPIDKELKKYPMRKRKRLKFLWEEYQNGKILKFEEKPKK